jgi:serine/threonine protein phosphatase PrpC
MTQTNSVISLGSGQDRVFTYKKNDTQTLFGVLFDGHGYNSYINKVDSLLSNENNIIELMNSENPIQWMIDHIPFSSYKNILSGSTCSTIHLSPTKLITHMVGDSTIYVFCNGDLIYQSKNHNLLHVSNEKEKKRLYNNLSFLKYKKTTRMITIGKNDCETLQAHYYYFDDIKLAMTQSLGHDNITGIDPEIFTYDIQPEEKIRVVVGSDGLWDVMNLSAIDNKPIDDFPQELREYEMMKRTSAMDDMNLIKILSGNELAKLAEQRWKQDWQLWYRKHKYDMPQKYLSYDDISVIVFENEN